MLHPISNYDDCTCLHFFECTTLSISEIDNEDAMRKWNAKYETRLMEQLPFLLFIIIKMHTQYKSCFTFLLSCVIKIQ